MEINILDIRESQVNELKKFKKTTFSVDQIMDTASQLKYTNEFKIEQVLFNPFITCMDQISK